MQMKAVWILSLLLVSTLGFVVDQSNYFYLNSSYARQSISLSMCFGLNQSTQIRLASSVLIPQGNHVMVGSIQKDKSISFENPYDSQLILYNSYEGEHWFGVRLRFQNPKKYDFVTLEMHFKQQTKNIVYTFLVPLFTMPLNGILVSPTNTLYVCQQSVLISYLYSHSEVDFYAFGSKNTTGSFKVTEKKDWGFYKQDFTTNYLRHKSKSKGSNAITLKFIKNNEGNTYECKVSQQNVKGQTPFSADKEGFKLSQLLISSKRLEIEAENSKTQL